MGFNVTKRVADLRRQVDQSQAGRWGLFRVTFLSILGLTFFALLILPPFSGKIKDETYGARLEAQFRDQLVWLENTPLALIPGASSRYEDFGSALVNSLKERENAMEVPTDEEEENGFVPFTLDSQKVWFRQLFTGFALRLLFVLCSFWPLWIIAGAAGYFFTQKRGKKPSTRDSILSVCDRNRSPFYSGIYGPLNPNNSFSGTDMACPSLACPPEWKRPQVLEHRLAQLLKSFNAVNETTLGLLGVILAHRDFPASVGEENTLQQPEDDKDILAEPTDEEIFNQKGYIMSANGWTVEQSTAEGLLAILEAHRRLTTYRDSLEKKNIKTSALNKNYPSHAANLVKLGAGLSPVGQLLVQTLTPNRIWALGQLPPSMIATAYLAIEAGKSLVYKRHGDGFSRISNYPHLQARAVLQSIAAYNREYTGDTRLVIRQSIICSRRHGDFGRSFLPNRMPIESRAMRDWLEILWSDRETRSANAKLVELDAHLEEIGVNWRLGFANQVKQFRKDTPAPEIRQQAQLRGLPYKSVVLMPVERVVQLSLRGIHPLRKQRISELLDLTRSHQMKLSISARLPGFKRQAMEAERSGDDSESSLQRLAAQSGGNELINDWRIVRRMLSRYNWLSTRVGDDAVPLASLVQAVVAPKDTAKDNKDTAIRFESMVPLRQRRFSELFGKNWELQHFHGAPNPEDIEVFASQEALEEALRLANEYMRQQEAAEQQAEGQTTEGELSNEGGPTRTVASG